MHVPVFLHGPVKNNEVPYPIMPLGALPLTRVTQALAITNPLDKLRHVEQLAIILHSEENLRWKPTDSNKTMDRESLVKKEMELFGEGNTLFGDASTIYGVVMNQMLTTRLAWLHHVLLCFFCLEPSRP